MATKPDFTGKWQVYKSENFEDFLAANGAPWLVRKAVPKLSPVTQIEQTAGNEEFSVTSKTAMFTREEKFSIGKEFEVAQMDGSKSKAIANWEEDKLVINYEPVEGNHPKPQKLVRELKDGEIVMTMLIDDVEAKRYLKKIE